MIRYLKGFASSLPLWTLCFTPAYVAELHFLPYSSSHHPWLSFFGTMVVALVIENAVIQAVHFRERYAR